MQERSRKRVREMVSGHPFSADADVYAVLTGSLQVHALTRRKGNGFCCLLEPVPELLTLAEVAHNPSQFCPVFRQIVIYPSPVTAGAGSGSVYGVSVFTANTVTTDPTNNLKVFYAKFPTRLSTDTESFLHPVNNNPKKILTKGAMAILLMKEGEGKDMEKAAVWYKLFTAATQSIRREKGEVVHIMRSISDRSPLPRANLGGHYPSYYFR